MMLYGVVWCCMLSYGVLWCSMVLCCVVLYCVVLCCVVLCCIIWLAKMPHADWSTSGPEKSVQTSQESVQTSTRELQKKSFQSLQYNTKNQYDSHIINSLLTSFARSVRESIAFGFYLHRPRSCVARSVRKTSGNTFPYRPRTRLISP